jgi:hypothetical protein
MSKKEDFSAPKDKIKPALGAGFEMMGDTGFEPVTPSV